MKEKRFAAVHFILPSIIVSLGLQVIGTSVAAGQDTALIIGNKVYDCYNDLPGVIPDIMAKHNALANAGWLVVNAKDENQNIGNLTEQQMKDAINDNLPTTGKKYIVWYAGHGNISDACNGGGNDGLPCVNNDDCPGGVCQIAQGQLVGVDHCPPPSAWVDANEFIAALKGSQALVILDSCGGGKFKDAVNAALGGAAGNVGFITSTTLLEGAGEGCRGGEFTQCFVDGLDGLADGADGSTPDAKVTVAEAVAYATTLVSGLNDNPPCATRPRCGACDQHPTSDNDPAFANWVIGKQPQAAEGFCTLNLEGKGAVCIPGISEAVCVEKNGVWNATACIPTVSEWGLVVMGVLVLTAGTVVVMRRRAMVRGGS